MKTARAITAIALAGLAHTASGQVTLRINADFTRPSINDTVTWTVSVTGLTNSQFVQAYDLNFDASSDVGNASEFVDNLTPLLNPMPGTPSGASILGANGGQSTILSPLDTVYGDIVLGTFTTSYEAEGILSYDVSDGGVLGAPLIRVRNGSDFGAITFEGRPIVISDSVGIPAPQTAAVLALGAAPLTRRRRT